jgi:ATP-dependent helicase IRC3
MRRVYSLVQSCTRPPWGIHPISLALVATPHVLVRQEHTSAYAFRRDDHDEPPTASFSRTLPTRTVSAPTSTGQLDFISPPTVLRGYQEDAIQACLDALSSGLTRIGVSSPTGSGKTTMFMHLIPRITASADGAVERGKTLILVGSVELANQAEGAAVRLLGPDWSVEVEQASRRASGHADV